MAWVNLMDVVYPVGSFYISINSTSPASFFGGTWSKLDQAVLRAASGTGYTGSDTVTLTKNQLPQHQHIITWAWGVGDSGYVPLGLSTGDHITGGSGDIYEWGGGPNPVSVVQRSYNCHIWYRTA